MTVAADRRLVLHALFAAGLVPAGAARAQSRVDTMRLVVGYPPGGSVDLVARRIAERLAGSYARAAVVENRPGASGRLAVDAVKAAAPDGATLLVTPGSVVTMYPHTYRNLSYDPFTDLVPVSIVAATDFAFSVGPGVPAAVRTLADLGAWAKAQGAPIACGNAGTGSFQHFLAMLVARETGIAMTHVGYKGSSAAGVGLAGGEIPVSVSTESSVLPHQRAGRVRVLATTGAQRSETFPDVPTFGELGMKALVQREWFASFMPGGTPAAAAAAASDTIRSMMREPDVRETWRKAGLAPEASTPDALRHAQRAEHDFWGPIIRASGFTPEA